MSSGTTPAALPSLPDDWQRALCVVAHPDDLEYGCAAAVAEWTAAGRDVAYVLVTRGEAGIDGLVPEESAAVREQEQRASAAAVGVTDVEFLGHPDGVLQEGPALRRDVAAAVRRFRPQLLVTVNHHEKWPHGAWNTPDHRTVGRTVLDAATDAGNRWIFPELVRDAGLAPWDGVRWTAVVASPQPTHVHAVGPGFEPAVASLACHRAYIEGLGVTEPPEQYARGLLTRLLGAQGEVAGLPGPALTFEVFAR